MAYISKETKIFIHNAGYKLKILRRTELTATVGLLETKASYGLRVTALYI